MMPSGITGLLQITLMVGKGAIQTVWLFFPDLAINNDQCLHYRPLSLAKQGDNALGSPSVCPSICLFVCLPLKKNFTLEGHPK